MKNRIVLLLSAAAVLGIASCSNNNKGEGSYTQEQLDSIAKYRADSTANALKIANDSLINAKADSIAAAEKAKNQQPAAAKTQSKTTPPAVKKVEPTKVGSSAASSTTPVITEAPKAEPKRTQADIEADKKAARFGDKEAEARLKKDEELKKAARFGDKAAQEELKKREADKKEDRFKKNN